MSVVVRELQREDEAAWASYIASHPQGTFFHSLTWRDAVQDAFGHESRYLTAWRDEQLVGVFPLACVSSRIAGTILVSVPYAVYGGSLADDAEAHAELLDEVKRIAHDVKAQWVDIRSQQVQWPDLPVVKRYVTFQKALPDDPDAVLGQLPRKARAAARQAREKFELTADFDPSRLREVWRLYSLSMRRLASPNYPARFFQALIDRTEHASYPRSADGVGHVVQLVLRQGQPIAGLISFLHRGTMIPYFSGCDDRYQMYHPNNFLYLSAMEEGVRLGARSFDFGRTRIDNEGPYNFKRFQGFEPTPLNYQYYVPSGGKAPDLHPGNPRLSLARRIWPRLPLAVTRPLGAWIAKSIPG